MENDKMNQERISPYTKKPFVTKNDLLNFVLFLVLCGITAFHIILENPLPPGVSRNTWHLLFSSLGAMSVSVLIGFILSKLIYKGKDRNDKIKYGFVFAIAISILFLFANIIKKSEEVKTKENLVKIESKANKFQSNAGKYSILFPGIPTSENTELDTAIGKIILHQSFFSNDKVAYAVNYLDDESEEIMTEERIKEQLISMRDGSIRKIVGRLLSSSFFKFTSPSKSISDGIDFSAECENTNLYFGKIIRIKNRIYQLVIVTKINKTPQAEIENFFNSFYSNY